MAFLTDDEIHSQPDCWQQAADLLDDVRGLLPADGERVAFVGTGTAWFMAQAMAALREKAGMGESDAYVASEFPRTRRYDRIVVLTRSGATTDVNRLLADVQGQLPTLALLGNFDDSPSADLADAVIDLSFADEASVVQTRFATTALALTRAWVGDDLDQVVAEAREALQVRITDEEVEVDQVTYLGRGWTVGLAHEAALKFRQCSQSWSESYPVMEYRHGPIAVAEPGRVVWLLCRTPLGLVQRIHDTGATLVECQRDPMAELILTQRVAVGRAMKLGLSPDVPRNLARAVQHDDE
ncbi:SIS domain-containing protein [Granulicoccus sp. GXG6511]|uniref:SIS domain-containing protein n=1 Tax=Granulicoccus sp. GXG6511 TaxID=3381351 RepID=UPI003D7ECF53